MIFEKKRAKHLPVSEKAVPLHSKTKTGYHGRVARHRSAKPATAVRICLVPQSKEHLAMSCSFFLWLFPSQHNTLLLSTENPKSCCPFFSHQSRTPWKKSPSTHHKICPLTPCKRIYSSRITKILSQTTA